MNSFFGEKRQMQLKSVRLDWPDGTHEVYAIGARIGEGAGMSPRQDEFKSDPASFIRHYGTCGPFRWHGGPANFQNLARDTDFAQLEARWLAAHPEIVDIWKRKGEVSEQFRKDASKRKYETSYTKRVVDGLYEALVGQLFRIGMSSKNEWRAKEREAVWRAIDLLKDYHATMHAPYEQRDIAREEREQARNEVTRLDKQLVQTRTERHAAVAELANAKVQLADASKCADRYREMWIHAMKRVRTLLSYIEFRRWGVPR